ncbi:MAG: hypothetical protein RIS72_394, partial [Pseudomonadota bacterium]
MRHFVTLSLPYDIDNPYFKFCLILFGVLGFWG